MESPARYGLMEADSQPAGDRKGGVVFTTMQKFQTNDGNMYDRENIIVIADEAHRTQYGFKAKTIDTKDANGHVAGKKPASVRLSAGHVETGNGNRFETDGINCG